jgi:uncharacterized membrane protein HdeD (DUF308 family)
MAKESMKDNKCWGGKCHACHGGTLFILGLIVLANVYWPFLSWGVLIGLLLVLGGILKWVKPHCGHCK